MLAGWSENSGRTNTLSSETSWAPTNQNEIRPSKSQSKIRSSRSQSEIRPSGKSLTQKFFQGHPRNASFRRCRTSTWTVESSRWSEPSSCRVQHRANFRLQSWRARAVVSPGLPSREVWPKLKWPRTRLATSLQSRYVWLFNSALSLIDQATIQTSAPNSDTRSNPKNRRVSRTWMASSRKRNRHLWKPTSKDLQGSECPSRPAASFSPSGKTFHRNSTARCRVASLTKERTLLSPP